MLFAQLQRGIERSYFWNVCGHPSAVVEGMEMCRDGGKYLVLGHYCDAGPISFNPHVITRKQLQVFGSWSSEPRHMKAALEFLRTHRDEFPFDTMVTHRFSWIKQMKRLKLQPDGFPGANVIVP